MTYLIYSTCKCLPNYVYSHLSSPYVKKPDSAPATATGKGLTNSLKANVAGSAVSASTNVFNTMSASLANSYEHGQIYGPSPTVHDRQSGTSSKSSETIQTSKLPAPTKKLSGVAKDNDKEDENPKYNREEQKDNKLRQTRRSRSRTRTTEGGDKGRAESEKNYQHSRDGETRDGKVTETTAKMVSDVLADTALLLSPLRVRQQRHASRSRSRDKDKFRDTDLQDRTQLQDSQKLEEPSRSPARYQKPSGSASAFAHESISELVVEIVDSRTRHEKVYSSSSPSPVATPSVTPETTSRVDSQKSTFSVLRTAQTMTASSPTSKNSPRGVSQLLLGSLPLTGSMTSPRISPRSSPLIPKTLSSSVGPLSTSDVGKRRKSGGKQKQRRNEEDEDGDESRSGWTAPPFSRADKTNSESGM